MAEIHTILYQCDVCKRKFEKATAVQKTIVPCYTGATHSDHSSTELDLCKVCAKKLRQVIYDHFADIYDYYSLMVTKKYADEDEDKEYG